MRFTLTTRLAAALSGMCIATTAAATTVATTTPPEVLDSVSPGLGALGLWWAGLLQALLG